MQHDAPLDAPLPDSEREFAGLAAQSRRSTVALGIAIALAIVVAAWYVGGRDGVGQLGRGGVNLSLLPKVGQPAPDFVVMLTDGRFVRLSDFRGRPVWLNFWGSWCPPCRAEMPELQAAYAELHPRGLELLAVSLNEPTSAAADYAARNRVSFLVASDPRRVATGAAYPIANFPTHVLIDRDGVIRDIVLAELSREEIVERAQRILPEQG